MELRPLMPRDVPGTHRSAASSPSPCLVEAQQLGLHQAGFLGWVLLTLHKRPFVWPSPVAFLCTNLAPQNHTCQRAPPPFRALCSSRITRISPPRGEHLAKAVLSFLLFLVCVFERTESKLLCVTGTYERKRVFSTHSCSLSQTQERRVLESEHQQIRVRTFQMVGLKWWDGLPRKLEHSPSTEAT